MAVGDLILCGQSAFSGLRLRGKCGIPCAVCNRNKERQYEVHKDISLGVGHTALSRSRHGDAEIYYTVGDGTDSIHSVCGSRRS